MADPAHVIERLSVVGQTILEEAVLLDQGGDMPGRRSDRQNEARIIEQLLEIGEPGQIVVALGEIALAAAHREQLSDVIPIEVFEGRDQPGRVRAWPLVVGSCSEGKNAIQSASSKASGTVLGDLDPVFMRALGRVLPPSSA